MIRFLIRFSHLLAATLLYAVGIVITLRANVGYVPWDVFHAGLAQTVGISFGVATIVVGAVIVAFVAVCGEKIGIGTIISMTLTGIFIDLIMMIEIIPLAPNMAIGTAMLVSGLLVVSIATYFYIRSAFGAGPRDNLMVVLTRKTKIPVGVCRSIVELAVTLAGWLLGGMVGIGTLISVIAVGFCIQLVFKIFRFNVAAVKHETLKQTYKTLVTALRDSKK